MGISRYIPVLLLALGACKPAPPAVCHRLARGKNWDQAAEQVYGQAGQGEAFRQAARRYAETSGEYARIDDNFPDQINDNGLFSRDVSICVLPADETALRGEVPTDAGPSPETPPPPTPPVPVNPPPTPPPAPTADAGLASPPPNDAAADTGGEPSFTVIIDAGQADAGAEVESLRRAIQSASGLLGQMGSIDDLSVRRAASSLRRERDAAQTALDQNGDLAGALRDLEAAQRSACGRFTDYITGLGGARPRCR